MRAVEKRAEEKGKEIDERETEFYLNDRESFRTLAQMARIVQTELGVDRGSSRSGKIRILKRQVYMYTYISFCNKRIEYVLKSLKLKS